MVSMIDSVMGTIQVKIAEIKLIIILFFVVVTKMVGVTPGSRDYLAQSNKIGIRTKTPHLQAFTRPV